MKWTKEQLESKAKLRSWLYRMLSELECSHLVNAEITTSGNLTTIQILFGVEPK